MEIIHTKSYPTIAQSVGMAGIMVLSMIVFSPMMLFSKSIDKELMMFIYYVIAIGAPVYLCNQTRAKKTGESSFNLSISNYRLLIPIILTSIALLFGVISPLAGLIPIPESFKEILLNAANDQGIFSFLTMVIAAPILEEIFFRGIMLDGLLEKYSPVKAILVSSFLFGFVHLNPVQFITGFILGIFAGWVYYKTKNLTLAIIIHMTANLSGFITRFFADSFKDDMDMTFIESYDGWLNFILATVVSISVIIASIFFLKKEFAKKTVEESSGILE